MIKGKRVSIKIQSTEIRINRVLNKIIALQKNGIGPVSLAELDTSFQQDCFVEQIYRIDENGIEHYDVQQIEAMPYDIEIELQSILDKLNSELWITIANGNMYYLSTKSTVQDCYITSYRQNLQKEIDQGIFEIQKKENDHWIKVGTLIAGIATTLILLLDLAKIFFRTETNAKAALIPLFFGIFLGGIFLVTIQEWTKTMPK
jgi:hypothetical protein